jgi:hypothetical protein
MTIRIVRNENGNCITFVGSSQPAYWNSCLSGEINAEDSTRINVINDIRTTDTADPFYEFFGLPYTEFVDAEGNSFANATETAAYITAKANVVGTSKIAFDASDTVNASRDATNTNILLSTGDSFFVHAIKAITNADGNIDIVENIDGGEVIYSGIRPASVTIGGDAPATLTAAAVTNALNSLFEVTPLGLGDIDPTVSHYYLSNSASLTTFGNCASASGYVTKGTNSDSQNNDGAYSEVLIAEPGEYLELDWNNTLASDSAAYGRDFVIGLSNSTVATTEFVNNTADFPGALDLAVRFNGLGSYENHDYGSVIENGFLNFPQTRSKLRFGLDDDRRLYITMYDEQSQEYQVVLRSAFVTNDETYRVVFFIKEENARVKTDLITSYEIDPAAVDLTYRYIESPDGDFYYPLFATEAEANFADTIAGGAGNSHSHLFADEVLPANLWYMPSTSFTHAGPSAPVNTANITYTEIPTQADSNFAPEDFTISGLTINENASVNYSVSPTGADYTTTVSGLPEGLTYQNGFIQGTARYVTQTETYTITVTRSNSFGTKTATFDITVNHNSTMLEHPDWTENGTGYIIQQPNLVLEYSGIYNADFTQTLDPGTELVWTQTNTTNPAPGGNGQYMQFGIVNPGVDKDTTELGNNTADWTLKGVLWTDRANHYTTTGWTDNTIANTGDNHTVEWKLSFPTDGGVINLYRNGTLLRTSATNFTGNQTITVGVPEAYNVDTKLPILTKATIGAGSTTPPTGFVDPLTHGTMDSTTVLGGDSVATLTMTLDVGKRLIVPQAWIESNVLPYIDSNNDKAYVGVPKTTADWGTVQLHTDFDAVMRWERINNSTHDSSVSVGNSANNNDTSINSLTDAFYDYAIEWDGTNLHVIRCNINSITTQPGVSAGGVFSFTASYDNYVGQSSPLPIVIATKGGGQVNLSTSGINIIDIPVVSSSATSWTNAINLTGYYESATQPGSSTDTNALRMGGHAGTVAPNADPSLTVASDKTPWITSCVFQPGGTGSAQGGRQGTLGARIWGLANSHSSLQNISLIERDGHIWFKWGYKNSENEIRIIENASTSTWYGVYIGFKGQKSTSPSAAFLGQAFDIYVMSSADSFGSIVGNVSTSSEWGLSHNTTGNNMTVGLSSSTFKIGNAFGTTGHYEFNGKVASCVVATQRNGIALPDTTEITSLITDPKGWFDGIVGTQRRGLYGTEFTLSLSTVVASPGLSSPIRLAGLSHHVWLMGDGVNDSFNNGIRNSVYPTDTNDAVLQLTNMVASDIETVSIPGLT